MNDVQLARVLGLTSLALGSAELASGRRMARELGIGKPELVQAFGGRELANGLLALAYPDTAWPIWARVAGDVLDLALLGGALGSGNPRRHKAAWAAIGVVGITLLDVACATMPTKRESSARRTARRTRVSRKPGEPMPRPA